jgi:hypothetical protein
MYSDNFYKDDHDNSGNSAHLVNNDLTQDKIREHARTEDNESDDILNNFNLKPTETDMKFEFFANPEKLVPQEDIKLFQKTTTQDNEHLYGSGHSEDRHDSVDDYLKHDDRPKASDYGPSYGDGPSSSSKDRDRDHDRDRDRDRDRDHDRDDYDENEENLKKLDMLRKLGELAQHGVKLSQNYNMKSDFTAMEYEYKLHRGIRDKQNGVKWLSNMLVYGCHGVELANDNFNPFDFKLKGWSESMAADSDDYYDVMGELYEKYMKSGKPIPPELKLMFMVGGSALMFHINQTKTNLFSGIGNAMNNNPNLEAKLMQQAVADKKKKDALNSSSMKEHETARQKAIDIQFLKEQEAAHIRMQQYQQQHQQTQTQAQQLAELQNQLQNQRSDSMSTYNKHVMSPPTIPSRLVDTFHTGVLSPAQQENLRQQQILDHKKFMYQQGLLKQGNEDEQSRVDINPNIDDILSVNHDRSSSGSIDDLSLLDHSDISESDNNKVAKKRKRKKSAIKLNIS